MKQLKLSITIALILTGSVSFSQHKKTFALSPNIAAADYEHNKIIVKVKPAFANVVANRSSVALNTVLQKLQATGLKKLFPFHQKPVAQKTIASQPMVDLTEIYTLHFAATIAIDKAINMLLATDLFAYAEPNYIYQPLYTPNDTLAANQWHHRVLKSYQAWDIQKGDTNIVIGYTDTGFDILHPELTNRVKYNYADPVNGIDDDGDGYLDNYAGWNVALNNNNVNANTLHGTFVAGIGSAQPDNVLGIAGIGFNTKFLPVACSPGSNVIVNGELAIIYAADKGADVINCSWGGFGSSQFSQDAVNYATFNQNALVVASAGNSDNDSPFYPASYQHVLSIAGTDSNDVRWGGSSYGSYVDVCAGGERVYSIFPGGPPYTYGTSGGTSESAPMVSGAAALVKAQFSSYNALQIGERLRATSDNIDTIPANALYVGKLGKGRINIFRALTEPATSVRAIDIIITDNNDNAFAGNDTLNISAVLVNYLDALTNLNVTLSCNQPLVVINNQGWVVGAMPTLDTDSNRATPFLAIIDPAIPRNTKVVFTLNYTDGTYTDFQKFEVTVNVDYINVLVNDVGLTFTSKGRLGFNDAGSQGIGFTHNEGPNLLYDGGLVVGIRDTLVSDCTYGSPAGTIDTDFQAIDFVHELIPSVNSDFDIATTFNDAGAVNPLPVTITNNAYAWGTPADRKYIITEYIIRNTGTVTFDSLYAGIFADWDLTATTYATNSAQYDAANRLGYAYEVTNDNFYTGIKLLTAGIPNYYAFDNDGAGGSINIYNNGLSKPEKFQALTTNRLFAGAGPGNDISMMLATGPFTIAGGDSIKVAFAIMGGDSLGDLTLASAAAQIKYDNLNSVNQNNALGFSINSYPNPFNNTVNFNITSAKPQEINLLITDVAGRIIKEHNTKLFQGKNKIEITGNAISNGIYFYVIKTVEGTFAGKIIKQ